VNRSLKIVAEDMTRALREKGSGREKERDDTCQWKWWRSLSSLGQGLGGRGEGSGISRGRAEPMRTLTLLKF
jgi:hypothetical protein